MFSLPGVCNLIISAVLRRGYPLIQGPAGRRTLYPRQFHHRHAPAIVDPQVRYWPLLLKAFRDNLLLKLASRPSIAMAGLLIITSP
ncbi:MAG: hypothetical protein MO852_04030 [Candidatus Devosia euplotis]|nr:hypothetical protein [Candidatus Devosia euplotis]